MKNHWPFSTEGCAIHAHWGLLNADFVSYEWMCSSHAFHPVHCDCLVCNLFNLFQKTCRRV